MGNVRTQVQRTDNHQPEHGDEIVVREKPPSPATAHYPPQGQRVLGAASLSDIPLTHDNLLFLQRAIGKRAVGPLLQRKGNLSQPGEVYERAADRVADQVLRMPEPSLSQSGSISVRS